MTAVTVIGNGPAAHRLVQRLRERGHEGQVTVLGAEEGPAYQRALLFSVLDGTLPAAALRLPPPPPGVLSRTGAAATAVDRRRRVVRTATGEEHPYDVLVLATGARAVRPPLPGAGSASAPGVRSARTLADARPVADEPVVVAGGGLRGVEAAHALGRAGHEVTLVHPGPHPMHRLLDARAGALLTAALEAAGVGTETGRRVAAVEPGKAVLDDGRLLPAGTLLLCAGGVPETALARAAGLAVRRGVLVDDQLRTSDPRVYALGDCAEHPGSPATLDAALDQADALARVLTHTGPGPAPPWRPAPHVVRPRLPGLDLLVAGPPGASAGDGGGRGADERDEHVVLSDPARGRYGRLVLRGERLRAAVLFGLPHAAAAVGRLYREGRPVPGDRLALLLGTDGEYAGSGELPDDAVVCQCNNVTKKAVGEAWRRGARDLRAVAAATRATTGCGSCAGLVRRVCEAAARP
ncbi:FAD-dependent oxidoreductase [Streptomyces marincola]|uniref:FAD/NAD(P)-binding oxidoreductase n=1 Tax=Streptomyces marincola TaxID=2878388 RepID=A0A1W7CYV1_9ACTN|nr:FAD-dependent oxidoreductase [Streptomyces marincola]ARQ69993.1 FAD/NAD(P)-binding oxidoreductase [Streptomyces marincola]